MVGWNKVFFLHDDKKNIIIRYQLSIAPIDDKIRENKLWWYLLFQRLSIDFIILKVESRREKGVWGGQRKC